MATSSANNNSDSDYHVLPESIQSAQGIELQNKHSIDQSESLLTQHSLLSVDDDPSVVNICITHHEKGTIFHHILSEKNADWIFAQVQSRTGGIIGFISVLIHCVSINFYSDNLSWFLIIFKICELALTAPASVMYFGTMNLEICIKILRQFTFWFKMYNVLIVNAMSAIWAYDHLEFELISKTMWFCIYGLYIFVNVMCTAMGCLLDCFKWPAILKIGCPLLAALRFGCNMFWWYYRADPSPAIEVQAFGYDRQFFVRLVGFNAALNVAIFFLFQFVSAVRHIDRASVLRVNVAIKWE